MKIALINGSPKIKDSTSGIILNALKERIGGTAECVLYSTAKEDKQEFMQAVSKSEAIVFAFPLYVDGIPSHLLRLLDEVHQNIADAAPKAMVYAAINNGFYEGRQNALALEMMRNFCVRSGLEWGQGINAVNLSIKVPF